MGIAGITSKVNPFPIGHSYIQAEIRHLTMDHVKQVSPSLTMLSHEASVEALCIDLTTRVWTGAMEEPSLVLVSWRIPLVHLFLQVDVLAIKHRILDSLNCGQCPRRLGGSET